MKEQSWFGEKRNTNDKDGILTKAGKGVLALGAVAGAGVLLGMGIGAVNENI